MSIYWVEITVWIDFTSRINCSCDLADMRILQKIVRGAERVIRVSWLSRQSPSTCTCRTAVISKPTGLIRWVLPQDAEMLNWSWPELVFFQLGFPNSDQCLSRWLENAKHMHCRSLNWSSGFESNFILIRINLSIFFISLHSTIIYYMPKTVSFWLMVLDYKWVWFHIDFICPILVRPTIYRNALTRLFLLDIDCLWPLTCC